MKRTLSTKHIIAMFFVYTLLVSSNKVYPIGAIAHPYVAQCVGNKLGETDTDLYRIIKDNWNDYLVGSDYPDTGFVPGATYGEFSHGQRFVDAYITHLHENYPTSTPRRDRLIAFLMGICTHIQSDITANWTYYDFVAYYDFNNEPDPATAWRTAEKYMDPGTDFYVIIKKHLFNHPVVWWVPVEDLVSVYSIMQKSVSAEEIIKGNVIYYFATGIDETLIALPAFLYNYYVAVPWGMRNLENPDPSYGAFPGQIDESVSYLRQVWAQYNAIGQGDFEVQQPKPERSIRPWISPAIPFVASAFDNKWLDVQGRLDSKGDFLFEPQHIVKTAQYEIEKKHFLDTLGIEPDKPINYEQLPQE